MNKLFLAFQFLTIIPLPSLKGEVESKEVGRSSSFFPLVGFIQGLLLVAFYIFLSRYLPDDVMAALLLCLLIGLNGGFHLDGLSDTFDALASRKSRERMLEIMKDSTTGPIGVGAIVLVLLVKFIVLKNILALHISFALPLVLFPVAGKWAMVLALSQGRSAAADGLGKMFLDNTGFRELVIASFIVMIIILVTLLSVYGKTADMNEVGMLLVPFGGVWFLSLFLVVLFQSKFRGMTGDNLGSICELGEALFLLLFLAVYTK
jgi:adenosylcobinamide-GDP ribazoletransferase